MQGDELWIAGEDARHHVAIAGTTGSGKNLFVDSPSHSVRLR
jgi:hypothetical protein